MKNLTINDLAKMGSDDCMKAQDGKCRICKEKFTEKKNYLKERYVTGYFIHHIIPKRFGGNDLRDNFIYLCRGCHAEVHKAYSDYAISRMYSENNNYFLDVINEITKEKYNGLD